jgi:hypothetical protein
MSAAMRTLLMAGLTLALDVRAQQRQTPDWTLTAPATTQQAMPPAESTLPIQQQRRQRVQRGQQPVPPQAMADDGLTFQSQEAMVPEGYQALRMPTPSSVTDVPSTQSHLPESSRSYEQQLEALRKRVATLVQQMDDLQVRMQANEHGLARHSHGYRIPNMGYVSVESYNSYLNRQQRIGQPVPFFSGYANQTTTPPVLPQ